MRAAGELLEQKLQAEPAFADALYPLLGIRRRHLFRHGVDYREQTVQAVEESKAADVDRPGEVQPLPGGAA